MKTIGIRELKDRLSEVLRSVRRHGHVLITRRGEVVAELRSTYGETAQEDLPAGLLELADSGSLRPGAPNDPGLYLPLEPALKGRSAADLLEEERGER